MRKFLLAATAVFASSLGFSQQDYQFSQYMFDRLSINPGYAGIENKICGTAIYRDQWMGGFDGGNPTTFLLNVHAPVKMLRGGVGLTFANDQIGFFNTNQVRLNYSYHLGPVGPGMLGIGISAGIVSAAVNPTWIAIDDPTQDLAIPANGTKTSQTTYDLGFGLYYKTNDLYVGLSSTHLTESDLTNLNVKNARHYYLLAGYNYQLPTTASLMLRPSIRVESDAVSTQFDLNVNVLWNNMVWGGISYRLKDAVVPMAGYQHALKNGSMAKIGLAYDVTTSEIKNYSSGSFELMVNYCFDIDRPKPPQKSKTVRFL